MSGLKPNYRRNIACNSAFQTSDFEADIVTAFASERTYTAVPAARTLYGQRSLPARAGARIIAFVFNQLTSQGAPVTVGAREG